MTLDTLTGYTLVSQQIRDKIVYGKLTTPATTLRRDDESMFIDQTLEARVQPASFDPIITEELFIIDANTAGIFCPKPDQTVRRTLLELPHWQRQHVQINPHTGFTIQKGFYYLIKLAETACVSDNQEIESSPKSSFGRLFLETRLLADYNPCFNKIKSCYKRDELLDLWLLVHPQAFDVTIYPGISLNQLRFFEGISAQLTSQELLEECKRNPLLYYRNHQGTLRPATLEEHIINEGGLQIHLDALGEHTCGIVGLRARHTHIPIDTKKIKVHKAENYHAPVPKDAPNIHQNEATLAFSSECIAVPPHLCGQLKSRSDIGMNAKLHDAGFFDNGFFGDCVFEIISNERAHANFYHKKPVGSMDFYRTLFTPDKVYGTAIGSNYQGQVGSKTAKFFTDFNFASAAKNYQKLDRIVLVHDARTLKNHRTRAEGFEQITPEKSDHLKQIINQGFFQSRYDCEDDELILQPIPHVIIFGPNKNVFVHRRAEKIQDYGETRLFGKYAIGTGGHIGKQDQQPDPVTACCQRELAEEVTITGSYTPPKLVGTLYCTDQPVDRVHLGLIFVTKTNSTVTPKDPALVSGRMLSLDHLMTTRDTEAAYETWTKALIPHLPELYDQT